MTGRAIHVPSNGKAFSACDTEGFHTDTSNKSNSATCDSQSKGIATQIAHLAMAGHAVHQLKGGGFLVCKYGYTYHAPTFEALQAFSRKLGVTQ